jgi:hypothetical protein
VLDSIRTIEDLTQATEEGNFDIVQHYLSQVTVETDLENYLLWLYDNEVTTDVVAKLRRERNRSLGIHPSSASKVGVCLLKLYYECTHEVPPGSAYNQKSQLTWDIGTLLHETYQKWFHDMYGDQFQSEVELKNNDGTIISHTDGIFSFTHYKFILEMKSIKEGGNYGWEKVQSKPQEDHVRQAHFYMKLSNTPFALLFYINKNAGAFKEHAIPFNPLIWNDIQNNVIDPVISAAYKNGPAVSAKSGWHCRWCVFQHGCPEKKRGTVDHAKW